MKAIRIGDDREQTMFLIPNPPSLVCSAPDTHKFQIANGKFMLDGKPMLILAGEMHYFRVPHQLWRQRIRMAKAMGLNAISTYVFWNMHEPEKGKFNFKGDADVAQFVRICKEEGMYVLLRPGPYACAEWEFGGYPYWLLKNPAMKIRTADPSFLEACHDYLKALARETVPLQVTHGGNILMVQVENEYGSYGGDHEYMKKVKDLLISVGYDVPLYVAEGGDQLARAWIPGTLAGVNGGSWPDIVKTVDKYNPGGPYMSPEFYPGWLDHWGEPMVRTDGDVAGYRKMISNGVSVSMYMFYGGTNFGFMNGANYGNNYEPDITSYDYDAPLDESGRPTRKYFKFRNVISEVTGQTPPPVPPTEPPILFPKVSLTEMGSLWGNLPKSTATKDLPNMETFNQAYGDLLYKTHTSQSGTVHLEVKDLRDFAVVMVNRKPVVEIDRRRGEHGADIEIPAGGADLELLVENSGRINYASKLPDNHKGVLGAVSLGGTPISSWETYPFPLSDPARIHFDGRMAGPEFYRGSFNLTSTGDAYLDMRGWHKGDVWINGHGLGRFWWVGPQQTLYVPSVWLNKGSNSVTVFDMGGGDHPFLSGSASPILDDLHAEAAKPKRPRTALGHTPDLTFAAPAVASELVSGDEPQVFKFSSREGRYLALQTLSTFADEDYSSLAEIELIDAEGHAIDRSKWKISYVDSEESAQEDGSAENLLDGDPESIWHSVWSTTHTGQPHLVVIDLGSNVNASAVRLTPRQGDHPAKLKKFEVYFGNRI